MMITGEVPSIELQTLLQMQFARAFKFDLTAELEWNGFKVTVRYSGPQFLHHQELQEAITVHDIFVPEQYRRQGWFTLYCEFLKLLTNDAVFVTNVREDFLVHCLERRGFSWAFGNTYIFRKPAAPERSAFTDSQ